MMDVSKDHKPLKLVITGGGTGGHLFPGIALAEAILAGVPGSEVLFVGTERQVDNRVLGNRPFKTAVIKCQGLKGKSPIAIARSLFQLPLAYWHSLKIMREFKPDLVMGVGGYVTGPVVMAAKSMGVPACIHEQNSIPGLANRMLGRFVDLVFLSIPGSEAFFPGKKTILTGNPVRKEILTCREGQVDHSEKVLAVLGGSQGAHRINQLVSEGLAQAKDRLPSGFKVLHQTGRQDEGPVNEHYKQAGIKAEVRAFFDDMTMIYSQADLVVSRAGATSLAEISIMGLPAILIPYPFAADNHQEYNARLMVDLEGAITFKEEQLTSSQLAETMISILTDNDRLKEMGQNARKASFPDAVGTIVRECLRLATEN